ncbi:putative polygalacturonase At2g43860 [Tasmannia lanceolata]|uniref:putative polygalacturonase At2g43860 n=1 Tax=Tasmannia lanceolata TaxID=3420 RepID=UPI004064C44B
MEMFHGAKEVVKLLVGLCVASLGWNHLDAASPNIFNVVTFGALGNGETDDSKVVGNLLAPPGMLEWKDAFAWLAFSHINLLTIDGSGQMNGQGSVWWPLNCRVNPSQGGSGYARGISFEHITINSVDTPIMIDQNYLCANNCPSKGSDVRVSDVKFIGIHGTSTTGLPIKLQCSHVVPCTDIVLSDIILTAVDPRITISSNCNNTHGPACPGCIPAVPCLGQ